MLFSFRMADDGSVAVCEYSRSPSQFYYYVVPLYASVSACSVLLLMMMMMILSIYLSSLVGITRQMCTYQIIFPTSKTRRVFAWRRDPLEPIEILQPYLSSKLIIGKLSICSNN